MTISESEAQRYDRQIRVWGAEAQSRIQSCRVLVCGLRKLNIELVKNLVLAGMNLTIQDEALVDENDLECNFFLVSEDIGKHVLEAALPRIQSLNNFAKIETTIKSVNELDDQFFEPFDVVLMSSGTETAALRVNELCRTKPTKACFFWSDGFGDEALFYADFGANFTYQEDIPATNINNTISSISRSSSSSSSNDSGTEEQEQQAKKKQKTLKDMKFPSLKAVLGRSWKEIPRRFFPLSSTFVKHRIISRFREEEGRFPSAEDDVDRLYAIYERCMQENALSLPSNDKDKGVSKGMTKGEGENKKDGSNGVLNRGDLAHLCAVCDVVPVMVCSVLGSFLSQEVIKAVSRTGTPAYNVCTFTGSDYVMKAIPIDAAAV